MTITLPTLPGLTPSAVHNVPVQWDKTWYKRHIRDFLQWADVRNSISGPGISVTGNLNGPATISINSVGTANSTFQSGDVPFWQTTNPGGLQPAGFFTHSNKFIFGLAIPLPDGTNGAALLLGSGFGAGGSGTPGEAWILTDQAFNNVTPGNTLGITAGETQGSGTANGGLLWLLGGASFGGVGGELRLQGGTSANGNGGIVNILGGNATGAGIPGDVFLSAGQTGSQGANAHIISTTLGGVPGAIRFRNNSTLLYEIESTGALFIGNTVNSFGLNTQAFVSGGPGVSPYWLPASTLGATSISGILPGGMILKAGQVSVASGNNPVDVAITFPVAFPTACVGVFPCSNRSVASAGQAVDGSNFASSITRTGATLTIDNLTGNPSAYFASWFAIGF
jgi:hypothetical protein